jgi:hypothetical protein
MKLLSLFAVALFCVIGSLGAEEVRVISTHDWRAFEPSIHSPSGQPIGTLIRDGDREGVLRIENLDNAPVTVSLLEVDASGVSEDTYVLDGELRYQGVKGDGYLEMWNHFEDGGAYFSRTLGVGGPMGKLSGSSGWRDFALPFNATGAESKVKKLVVNLHLPGKGMVWLGSQLTLSESSEFGWAGLTSGWWSARATNLVGGILGATFGVLGALAGWLAQRGRGRAFVMGLYRVLLSLGVVSLVVGVTAVLVGQPYHVWFGPCLFGLLGTSLGLVGQRRFERRFREMETRRMMAMDAA